MTPLERVLTDAREAFADDVRAAGAVNRRHQPELQRRARLVDRIDRQLRRLAAERKARTVHAAPRAPRPRGRRRWLYERQP